MAELSNRLPRSLYRAEQVRQLDALAIDKYDIPAFKLMQAAGAATFDEILEAWPQVQQLVIFTGAGNNAGDGFVIAALAQSAGLQVQLIELAERSKFTGAAAQALQQAADMNIATTVFAEQTDILPASSQTTVIVDALLGTGLDRTVQGAYAAAIAAMNASDWPVVAVDIPSGLNADTGALMGCAVQAELTVTFIAMKIGLLTGAAGDVIGRLVFASLDIPEQVYRTDSAPTPVATRLDINSVGEYLPTRRRTAHKGDHGHVVLLGGDQQLGGAIIMAAEAAARAGAGLVSVITRSCHRPALLARRPEVMVLGTEDDNFSAEALLAKASVIVIGPGLGRSGWSRDMLQLALGSQRKHDTPLVVDADGLQLLAERRDAGANKIRNNWILTPHPGEAGELLGIKSSAVQADRVTAVQQLVAQWGGSCLLKGYGSLIADSENLYLSTEGNPGMGSGGMGDVLAGLIAGLVAQGLPLTRALNCAVCVHGEAADLAASRDGQRGLLASDLFPFIRQLLNPPARH